MIWKPLVPDSRSPQGAEIRFTIRPQSKNQGVRLGFSIRQDIVKKAGLSDDDPVRMYFGKNDKGTQLCRLALESGPGSKKFHQLPRCRGSVEFSNNGDVLEAWTDNLIGMTDLTFVSVAKNEIIFEMPVWEVEE